METIKIPKLFYGDHVDRDLPAPAIVRETKRHYFIDANSEHLNELLDDAGHYGDPSEFSCEFGGHLWGVIRSANATEKAIKKYLEEAAQAAGGASMNIYEAAKAFVACHNPHRIDVSYIEQNYGSIEGYLSAEGGYGGEGDLSDRYIEVSSRDSADGNTLLIEWDGEYA